MTDWKLTGTMISTYKKILSYEYTPIVGLISLCLLIGIFTVKDYGESWDEAQIFDYAHYSIQAYQYILHPKDLPLFVRDFNYYGPAYFMVADISSRLISQLEPAISIITARHFVYFITSLLGILALYLLSRRWMSKWAAFGVTLLFITQPLIWGHSFINPKDIPFMAFFLISIYLGFQMVDAAPNSNWKQIVPAGIVLGLTISMRVIAPLAGCLVFLYGLLKFPRKTITTAPYYFLVAGAVTFLTWPYLWKTGIGGFFESLELMSKFPYKGQILFMGDLYFANQLPRRYFPTLLGLQLTEPTLILIGIGLIVSLWFFVKKENREPILLFVGWFLLPALWVVLSHSPLYDNARQLLFLWPPLFILTGLGIDQLMTLIKHPQLRAALLIAMILPGIYANINLYPYEYIYYNNLIGGVRGAYRKFELDYWNISFRESMDYIDEEVPQGTKIIVIGASHVAKEYARPDLSIGVLTEQYARPDLSIFVLDKTSLSKGSYSFILASTRSNEDLTRYTTSDVVFTVKRNDSVLAYVKKINYGQ